MNILNVLKESALQRLAGSSVPIEVSEETINKAAANIFPVDSDIRSLTLTLHHGWFGASTNVNHKVANFDAFIGFEIVRFEIGKDIQLIELRQRGDLETKEEGLRNKIAVYVVKTFISAILGKSLLRWGLKNQEGIKFIGDLVVVDLAKMGVKDALFDAMAEKLSSNYQFLPPVIQKSAGKVADYIKIDRAESKPQVLRVSVSFLPHHI